MMTLILFSILSASFVVMPHSNVPSAIPQLPGFTELAQEPLTALPDKGLAHDHFRFGGSGYLLRVPKQSQRGYAASANLAYQAACFERVSASGHGPRLHSLIEPNDDLPLGALLVDFIEGRPPKLPDDLPALATAMAAIHALPLPSADQRAPLEDHADPLAGAMEEVMAQAAYLDAAGLEPQARALLEEEMAWAADFRKQTAGATQPVTLVLTDTHPGNFLIQEDGKAVIVDLEKALYGSPGIDLAHATVYSSTTWDLETSAPLSLEDVATFYRGYLADLPAETASALKPWLIPMRRVLQLRALTWCALWRVENQKAAKEDLSSDSRDWSAQKSDPALIAHVKERVDHYLSPRAIVRMTDEWKSRQNLRDMI